MSDYQQQDPGSIYRLVMQVRDYECDMGGVVNNSVYFNYCEHARHEYLKTLGIDFAAYAKNGINFVVVRSEMDYKASLSSGDVFEVSVSLVRVSRLRFAFEQIIRLQANQKLIAQAKIFGAALDGRGRPCLPEEIEAVIPLAE
jgi:acyl-CoA thioester hydrolase